MKNYCQDSAPSEVYDPDLFSVVPGTYVDGYLQDMRYFESVRAELSHLFAVSPKTLEMVEKIERSFGIRLKDCLAVHVRRGDYWTEMNRLSHPTRGWVLPPSYYDRACTLLNAGDWAAVLVISDAKDHELERDFAFLKRRVRPPRASPPIVNVALDFAILANAGACVVANSTFSWWAAYLNQAAAGRIVAPQFFFGWWRKIWVPCGLRLTDWHWADVD